MYIYIYAYIYIYMYIYIYIYIHTYDIGACAPLVRAFASPASGSRPGPRIRCRDLRRGLFHRGWFHDARCVRLVSQAFRRWLR